MYRAVFLSLALTSLIIPLVIACAPATAPSSGTGQSGSNTPIDTSGFDKAIKELEALKKDTGTATKTPGATTPQPSPTSGLPDLVIDEIYLSASTRKGFTGPCGAIPQINTDGKAVRVEGLTIDYTLYESWAIMIKIKNLGPGTLDMAGKGAGKVQQWVEGKPAGRARAFYADRSDLTIRAGDFVLANTDTSGLGVDPGAYSVKFRVNYDALAAKGYEQPLPESNYNNNERDFKLTYKPCPPKK